MFILRILLSPFTIFYYLLMYFRNKFFDLGILEQKKVARKVISIGNITFGGTGKTPTVVYLAKLLKSIDKRPAILSRGYGRETKGFHYVSSGEEIFQTPDKCGDEIYFASLESKVPSAVSENRVYGAVKLIERFNPDVILLDDGFQHRWLNRDIDILIFDQSFLNSPGIIDQYLLPLGMMREPFSSVRRADILIVNRKFSENRSISQKIIAKFSNSNLFEGYYSTAGVIDLKRNTEFKIKDFIGQKSLVVVGIANPNSFFNILKKNSIDTQNRLIFKDHKNYKLEDIQRIRKLFYESNSYSVITTQKDAVKLQKYSTELDDIDIFYLKIKFQIDEEEKFKELIKNMLN